MLYEHSSTELCFPFFLRAEDVLSVPLLVRVQGPGSVGGNVAEYVRILSRESQGQLLLS